MTVELMHLEPGPALGYAQADLTEEGINEVVDTIKAMAPGAGVSKAVGYCAYFDIHLVYRGDRFRYNPDTYLGKVKFGAAKSQGRTTFPLPAYKAEDGWDAHVESVKAGIPIDHKNWFDLPEREGATAKVLMVQHGRVGAKGKRLGDLAWLGLRGHEQTVIGIEIADIAYKFEPRIQDIESFRSARMAIVQANTRAAMLDVDSWIERKRMTSGM
mgnify:FL=1